MIQLRSTIDNMSILSKMRTNHANKIIDIPHANITHSILPLITHSFSCALYIPLYIRICACMYTKTFQRFTRIYCKSPPNLLSSQSEYEIQQHMHGSAKNIYYERVQPLLTHQNHKYIAYNYSIFSIYIIFQA